jgi:hypothetical protein
MVAAGMNGSIGIAGSEAEVDVPFSTILDNLDLAGMVHFDMMNERWAISSDLIFMNLEDDEAVRCIDWNQASAVCSWLAAARGSAATAWMRRMFCGRLSCPSRNIVPCMPC